jgi:hypothetical protein
VGYNLRKGYIMKLTPTFNGTQWEVSQIIPNATIEPYPQNNDATTMPSALKITPDAGYVLHNKDLDYTDIISEYNEESGATTEKEILKRGYTDRYSVYGANYNFSEIEIDVDGKKVTAYGEREFFTIPVDIEL